MQTLKFNTGRQYTEAGQRIAAALLPNGDIYFSDIDRGIDGMICANGANYDEAHALYFTRDQIMRAYDHNLYTGGAHSMDAIFNDDFETAHKIAREIRALAQTL
jgi:hypothetical protein